MGTMVSQYLSEPNGEMTELEEKNMTLKSIDQTELFCLPSCAKCKISGKNPEKMESCPIRKYDDFGDECIPEDCEHYFEAWKGDILNAML